jgi:uncharacterized protein
MTEPAGAGVPRRTITVQGNGVVSAEPDRVVLRFGIRAFDPAYEAVMEKLNRRVETLRQDLDAVGVERTRLKTTNFNVHTKSKWEEDQGEEVFLGYVAEHDLKLTLPIDQELLNRAFARIAASAGEPTVSISFDVADRAELRRRVLRAAVEDACRSAEIMADAAGVDLGEIIRIEYRVLEVQVTSRALAFDMEAVPSVPAPDIIPSALHAEDRVNVVWEIRTDL